MGNFQALTVSNVVRTDWSYNSTRYVDNASDLAIQKADVFLAIFSLGQENYLQAMRKFKAYKILFEAPAAVNGKQGHGGAPRNTLVVFELAEQKKIPKTKK